VPRRSERLLIRSTRLCSSFRSARNIAVTDNITGDSASFGRFQLFPRARAIQRDGVPLALGNRALDILIALVERAGEVVTHKELLALAWRGLVVDPSNLRVHISSLRKALGDTDEAPRYIANVTGQGYCFVASVTRGAAAGPPSRAPEHPSAAARRVLRLPPVLSRMVGREAALGVIAASLRADRFVTIAGPGGMGKTTVAVAVANAMLPEFADAVCFVDVSAVGDPTLLAATIASSLGLTVQTADALPVLMGCLRTIRTLLIVLDNCEHVIDSAATLAELIFKEAPGVHILATSREALRVEGEHVVWLRPLESPAPDSELKAADVLEFSAVKLFMERVAASGNRFELSDDEAPIVAGICGRLDGLALAIELAAGRVGTHGIAGTAELLEKGLGLNWQGRRTAHPRHRTLHALLDWSYGSLTELEQVVFRRLSVLVGPFTIEAARAIVGKSALGEDQVAEILDRLVAKSLVSIDLGSGDSRYRLLETTRVYAAKKLEQDGEKPATASRHARYFAQFAVCAGLLDLPDSRAPDLAEHLGNLRAALDWCFIRSSAVPEEAGDRDAASLRFDLVAAAAPLLVELSLLDECHKWSSEALSLLDDRTRGSKGELVLQEARAISATWTKNNADDVRSAITRGLEIARQRDDTSSVLRLLAGLHIFLVRFGDFAGSRPVAEELAATARSNMAEPYECISDWLLGSSEHFIGNQALAQQYYDAGFARPGPRNFALFGLDYRVRALVTFARVLWLRGLPRRAMEVAREAVSEAAVLSKPLNACFAYLNAAPVFLWCGEYDEARELLEKLTTHPNWRALPAFHATGLALQGELLLHSGDIEKGLSLLSPDANGVGVDRQSFSFGHAACALAEGLAAAGRHDEAYSVICDAMPPAGSDSVDLPELLRIKAVVLLGRRSQSNESEAETCLEQSLACAQRQSALSWELRTAMTLAKWRAQRGLREQALELLRPIYERFNEGLETFDLRSAQRLLNELQMGWRRAGLSPP
jgi:predicted ATPase/DNA-binding winged helix-turn-helix (wHTH) protein